MLNQQVINQILRELTGIANQAKPGWTNGKTSSRTFGTPGGNYYSVVDETNEAFDGIVRRLLKHADWASKFSEKYIIEGVRSILGHAIDTGSTGLIATDFDSLLKRLEAYSAEHTVYVPIQGLAMMIPDLDVGSIVLRSVTAEFHSRLDQLCSKLKGFSAERLAGIKVIAEFHAVAEPIRAEERAEDEARRVVDVLRYWLSWCTYPDGRFSVGLQAELRNGTRSTFTVDRVGHVRYGGKGVGILADFNLAQETIDHIKKNRVFTLIDLLKRPSLTQFEQLLFVALRWFGYSQILPDMENRFLSLITVLETFLTQGNSPITAQISESVPLMFNVELQQRLRMKKDLQELYALRGKISHHGSRAVLYSDFSRLHNIVRGFLGAMTEYSRTFRTKDDLLKWVEQRRLGG
jgi:hypothetical protein